VPNQSRKTTRQLKVEALNQLSQQYLKLSRLIDHFDPQHPYQPIQSTSHSSSSSLSPFSSSSSSSSPSLSSWSSCWYPNLYEDCGESPYVRRLRKKTGWEARRVTRSSKSEESIRKHEPSKNQFDWRKRDNNRESQQSHTTPGKIEASSWQPLSFGSDISKIQLSDSQSIGKVRRKPPLPFSARGRSNSRSGSFLSEPLSRSVPRPLVRSQSESQNESRSEWMGDSGERGLKKTDRVNRYHVYKAIWEQDPFLCRIIR